MKDRVLLVDDEPNVLAGLNRQLRGSFSIVTANCGAEAIETVKNSDPFAVVVSDMRMPEMSGVETLKQIGKISPNTVRTMLTGNADQQTAIDAINTGNIFRFFCKPCPKEVIEQGLTAAVRQYKLINAEKILLEQTLAGSVKVLTDVLSLSDPQLFEQSINVRAWAKKLQPRLKLEHSWHLNLAAMLAPIGRVAVPKETLLKEKNGAPLSAPEKQLLARVPEISRDLISNIPRLTDIADIIYYQEKNYDGSGFPEDLIMTESIPPISRVLKILNSLALISKTSTPTTLEFDVLAQKTGSFDPQLLNLARATLATEAKAEESRTEILEIDINLVMEGDILQADIKNSDDQLLLACDYIVSEPQVRRLRGLAKLGQIKGKVLVRRQVKSSAAVAWH